jgi:hypothetical protein
VSIAWPRLTVSVTDAIGHELQAALLAGLTVAALGSGWHVVLAPRAAVGGRPSGARCSWLGDQVSPPIDPSVA